MVEESSSKRITRGSLAKDRANEERRSKLRNDLISQQTSSKKKRKADEVASRSDESSENDGGDSDKAEENDIEENEDVEYILNGTPTVTQHMQCYTNINAMDNITKCLSESQVKRFRETTCFSHLLTMNRCHVQAQLFKCFMLFELEGSSSDAFVIHINGCTLRFTRREFSLISGLKCCDEEALDFTFNTEEPNRLLAQYFQGQGVITKQKLVESFNNKVWGENDNDAVKFANLYFIHNFLMSEEPTSTTINREHFDLIESGRFLDYPWGNIAFEELTKNLHSKITRTGKYFRIHGFPLAMQIWLYECCSDVNQKIAKKVSDLIPRILNWETTSDQPRCDYIIKSLFRSARKKIIFRNISPTETETSSLQLPSEFVAPVTATPKTCPSKRPQANDSDDDFQTCPPIPKSNKGKGKIAPPSSPAKKKLRSSGLVAQKKAIKAVPNPPAKRPFVQQSLSPPARSPQAPRKSPTRRPAVRKKSNKPADKPSSSRSADFSISRDEFDMFKTSVKKEFQDLKKFIKSNFKDVLIAIRSKENDAKVHSSDHAHKSPSITTETRFAGVELDLNRGTSTHFDLEIPDDEGNFNHPKTGNNQSLEEDQLIHLQQDDQQLERPEVRQQSNVIVDKESTEQAKPVTEHAHDPETECHEGQLKSATIVDKQSDEQGQSMPQQPNDSGTECHEGHPKSPAIVENQSNNQGQCMSQQPNDPGGILTSDIQEVLQNIAADDNADVINSEENQAGEEKHIVESGDEVVHTNLSPTNQHMPCDNSREEQNITASQFELPDELLPSLNPESTNLERRIVLHAMAMADTTPLAILHTPLPGRRARRPGPYSVSPYMASFGSEIGSSSKQAIIFHQKHPFNPISENHDTSLYMQFWKWLRDGLLARHQNKKNNEDRYKKNKTALTVSFHFGVVNVSDKNWFYKLANEGQPIDDSHIDVIMYYLRKKAKYSKSTGYSFSTVDCNFSTLIHSIWKAYADLDGGACNARSEQTIISYINGFRLLAAVPWYKVDNIFIPVNVKDKFHWVLLVISFNDRSIMVCDSIRSTTHDIYIDNEVNKYAQLIPMYLATSGFYKNKGLDLNVHPRYKIHSEHDPFEIIHAKNIPQQQEESLDCGVYLAVYAEHLSDGTGIPHTPMDPELMRNRYAALLWDYGMRKIEEDAVSDNEAPAKPARTTIPSDVAEAIVI